jgi:hypothetical protein
METQERMDPLYDMFFKLTQLEEDEAYTSECLDSYRYDEFGNYINQHCHSDEDVEYIEELSWSLDSTQKEIDKIIQKMQKYIIFKKDINILKWQFIQKECISYLLVIE